MKRRISKILAGLQVLAMLIGMIPMGVVTTTFAATVASYTVNLTDGTSVLDLDDVDVTLTDSTDEEKTSKVQTVDGVATFTDFVEEGATYTLAIIGYDADVTEITVAEGDASKDVIVTEIEKATVSGVVNDEEGNPYEGATVEVSGYGSASATTDVNGAYSVDVYKGKEVTITVTPKAEDEKYKVESIIATYTDDTSDVNFKFAPKTFGITTNIVEDVNDPGEHGIITASENVAFGSDKDIEIIANTGYRIEKVIVNGSEKGDAAGLKTYTLNLTDIQQNYNIEVTFVRKTYTISFTVGANGEVTYGSGENDKVVGGSVEVEKSFDESTDASNPTVVTLITSPNEGYHVSAVKIDDEGQSIAEDNKYYLEMTESHTFMVEFSINKYNVTLAELANGTARLYDSQGNEITEKVKHGDKVYIIATPNQGYEISTIDSNTDYEEVGNDYKSAEIEITSDIVIDVIFEEKEVIALDAFMIDLPDATNEVNGITYVSSAADVIFRNIKDEYKRIRINGEDVCIINNNCVSINVGETGINDDITSVEFSINENAGGWTNPQAIQIKRDTIKPTDFEVENSGIWQNPGKYTFTVNDEQSGVKEVKYASTNNSNNAVNLVPENGIYSFSVMEEFDGDYFLWITDYCGNTFEKTVEVKVDKTAPTIEGFHFEVTGNSRIEKIINFLTFGIFANNDVAITVTASDGDGSGVAAIQLYLDGEEFDEQAEPVNEKNQATFIVSKEKLNGNAAVISAKAIDKVGNETENAVIPNTDNSNAKSENLMIETAKPIIDVKYATANSNKNSATKDNNAWYASDVTFTVNATDKNSGLRNVTISINGKELVNTNYYSAENSKPDTETHEETFTVSTNAKDVKRAEDGSYELKVTVTDNAGNVSEDTKKIYKDTDKPYITGFDFKPKNYVEGSETSSSVEITDYGFYFKKDTDVTISAKDAAPTSGVKSITYYTVDYTNDQVNGVKGAEKTVSVNANNQITVTIPANFKGQIYAIATDNVDNATSAYVTPNGAIVESEEKHKEEKHIVFDKKATSYTTNDGTELYSKDVDVKITVTDTYSGIRSIEWSVVAPYDTEKNQSGKVALNNDKTIASGEKDWTQSKTEGNLVTEMTKTIKVNNNSNNIIVKVKMTDRAGNTSEEQIEFSIDKTSPVINITYDENEVHDEEYTDFFSTKRTATITIRERNFRASDVEFAITNTDKTIPKVNLSASKNWKTTKNTENPDETIHVATVKYTVDGDYTFDISYKDNGARKANTIKQHKFTIDMTQPEVSVVYDNNDASNDNYYKEERTATITIKEHNFDADRVNVIGTATDNGTPTTFPTESTWKDNGDDTHTATISYSSDALYVFDIEFQDKAANEIDDFAEQEFYVDKSDPMIEFSGVGNHSANNGVVAPSIICSDTNFDKEMLNIELVGVNNGKVDYAYTSQDIENGQEFTYVDFEDEKAVDDIYTLKVSLTDKAGRTFEDEITFSVNRYGSVYDMSKVKDVANTYIQQEQDIVITETNADELDHDKIVVKLTKNGTPTTLVEGEDYSIEQSGGNGQWYVYTYTIKKELFADDGTYMVSIYSVDKAENINENIDESKEAELSFGVDKTNPIITAIDLAEGETYEEEAKVASFEIKDNLVLASVEVFLNDELVEHEVDGDIYKITIPDADGRQTVKVVATDAAGNAYTFEVADFYVTTNPLVVWFNNTPLFVGSIVGVVALGIGVAGFIVFGRKKKIK